MKTKKRWNIHGFQCIPFLFDTCFSENEKWKCEIGIIGGRNILLFKKEKNLRTTNINDSNSDVIRGAKIYGMLITVAAAKGQAQQESITIIIIHENYPSVS